MRNMNYVRTMGVSPKRPESDEMVWHVDMAIPNGNYGFGSDQKYFHVSKSGESVSAEYAMKAMFAFIRSY